MIRTFSMLAFALVVGMSSAAQAACDGTNVQIKNLTLNSDGVVTRSVYVKKDVAAANGNPATVKFVPIVRDTLKIEKGDSVILNAAPSMVDASLKAEITMKDQDRDAQGIFSTTYHVVEVRANSFGGVTAKTSRTAYLAEVKSTYIGKGTYSKNACGSVIKTNLDLESSTDVHQ
jgi:hypothetical protein